MNIRGRPFAIATGATFAALFVMTLVSLGVTIAFPVEVIDPAAVDPADPFAGIPVASTALSCLISICNLVLYVSGGALYAYLFNKETPVEVQDGAVGGALVVVIAGVISSVISTALSFVFVGEQISNALGTVPGEAGGILAVGVAGGAIFSLCCAIVIGGFLGAVGGAVGASVVNR